ncbi:hypothetical protein ACOSP7_014246 [Xanthoceras sorbifolium]
MNSVGIWMENVEDIEDVIPDFYSQLLKSNSFPISLIDDVVWVVDREVLDQMNDFLTARFIADEVFKALKQMPPAKSPSPVGLPARDGRDSRTGSSGSRIASAGFLGRRIKIATGGYWFRFQNRKGTASSGSWNQRFLCRFLEPKSAS